MPALTFQKQTARNLVLSANAQAAYGGVLADAHLTRRASVDASTVFTPSQRRWNDAGAVGHGTDFATADILTAWGTSATLKGMNGTDTWFLGWMMALICGEDTATGVGPYSHVYTIPNISSIAPCTTAYVEDTNDVHRKYTDMSAKSFSMEIPDRGPLNATLEMVGTGNFFPGTFSTALPAVPTQYYLLGSDVLTTITPTGGGATIFSGRQTGLSFKIDRSTSPFESAGDGLHAGSNQYGKLTYSLDLTIMALETDDVNGWFENLTPLNVTFGTNPALGLPYNFAVNFPFARFKANKLGNKQDLVAWQLSLDQTSVLQVGNAPAFSLTLVNECPAYLVPA